MRVAMRVDSSERIGTGHVMRCIPLAQALEKRGAEVCFVCRELQGNVIGEIEDRRLVVERLPAPAETIPTDGYASWLEVPVEQDARETLAALGGSGWDWIVVDHYALDYEWEAALRTPTNKVMVIDGIANRPHDCDLLSDSGYFTKGKERYAELVPPDCPLLLGPRYALLRDEFYREPVAPRLRGGEIRRVLVSFGGVDRENLAQRALNALEQVRKQLRADLHVTLVAGMANPNIDSLQAWCASQSWVECRNRVQNMARQMDRADLAVGAGGITTMERLHLGLPAITITAADNQREALDELATTGAIWHLGWHEVLRAGTIASVLAKLVEQPARVVRASKIALRIGEAGGRSGAELVTAALAQEQGARQQ